MRIPLTLGVVTTIAVTTLLPPLSAQATAERPLTPAIAFQSVASRVGAAACIAAIAASTW